MWFRVGRFFQRLARVCYVRANVCWYCGAPDGTRLHYFQRMSWCEPCMDRWSRYITHYNCTAHPWYGIRPKAATSAGHVEQQAKARHAE